MWFVSTEVVWKEIFIQSHLFISFNIGSVSTNFLSKTCAIRKLIFGNLTGNLMQHKWFAPTQILLSLCFTLIQHIRLEVFALHSERFECLCYVYATLFSCVCKIRSWFPLFKKNTKHFVIFCSFILFFGDLWPVYPFSWHVDFAWHSRSFHMNSLQKHVYSWVERLFWPEISEKFSISL